MRSLTPRPLALALPPLLAVACGGSAPATQQPATTAAAATPPAEPAPTAPVSNEVAPRPVAEQPELPPELPEVCRRYLAHLDSWVACPALPEDARQPVRVTVATFRDAWASFATMPPDARAAIAEDCSSAAAVIEQVAGSLGCPL